MLRRGTVDRRLFLRASAALPFVGVAATAAGEPSGLTVRQHHPENLETPFSTLKDFITPTDRFYVRNHFPQPKIDAASWTLKVAGAVERPLELSLDDIGRWPTRNQTALLECAGNGRVFLTPRARGVAWGLGAVSNAEWTGVPLAALLDKAGVKENAVDVILEGADVGEVADEPKSPGKIHFARSLPIAKARQPEVMLATAMNGQALTPAHGWPLRAVVPGWYGMASVKWLTRIVVVDRPFQGFFQTLDYSYWDDRGGVPSLVPITEMEVKAQIARPDWMETIPAGASYRIFGAAWSGEAAVRQIEVSTNGGKDWAKGNWLDKEAPFVWRRWELPWKAPAEPGRYTLMARATDSRGRTQPLQRDDRRRNYMISHVLPVIVTLK
jgi:DMSO/TMAO reductase YedYZ molybdopterin-dependent catalytic subunit